MKLKSIAACLALLASGLVAHAMEIEFRDIFASPPPHGIAYQVGDASITYEDLRRALRRAIDARLKDPTRADVDRMRREPAVFEAISMELINLEILAQEFKRQQMSIPNEILDDEVERFIATGPAKGDRKRYAEWLDSEGLTLTEHRDELRKSFIFSYMTSNFRKSLPEVSPEKIKGFYQQNKVLFYNKGRVKLGMIMLKPEASQGMDDVIKLGQKIQAEFEAGKPFKELYATYQGGGIDKPATSWKKRDELVQQLDQAAFALPVGQMSTPIPFNNQIVLLYVEDSVADGIIPLDECKAQVEKMLKEKIFEHEMNIWLSRMREKTFIKQY